MCAAHITPLLPHHYQQAVVDDSDNGSKETFNLMLADNTIYEMEDLDEDWKQNEGKSWKSGSRVNVPLGVEFLKNGKAKMNGKKPKINGEANNGNNGQGNKKDKKALFGRHLKARTEEQQRNVDLIHRHLSSTQGDKKVVAVRVSASDNTYSFSEDHLRSKVFGKNTDGTNSGDDFNLSSGYQQCSYGELTFSPKETTTSGGVAINNGVVTIDVAITASGAGDGTVRNAVTNKIQQLLGSSMTDVADYWMYCLPPGTSGSKFTYTFYNVALFCFTKLTCCIAWITFCLFRLDCLRIHQ
jgi:hypothetical protein